MSVNDEQPEDYFRRRKLAEQDAARKAKSEAARRIHQELAREYAEILRRT